MKATYREIQGRDYSAIQELVFREADKKEIEAVIGPDRDILFTTFLRAKECFVIEYGERVEAVFGVAEERLNNGAIVGVPWLVSSDMFEKFAYSVTKRARRIVNGWADRYAFLFNRVWKENHKSIQWLRFVGFTVDESIVVTTNGLQFINFWKVKENY